MACYLMVTEVAYHLPAGTTSMLHPIGYLCILRIDVRPLAEQMVRHKLPKTVPDDKQVPSDTRICTEIVAPRPVYLSQQADLLFTN